MAYHATARDPSAIPRRVMTEPRRCATQHRNARPVACAERVAEHRDRRTVIAQWAWCPDCRGLVMRRLVVAYIGGWETATERPPEPVDMARFKDTA